MFLIVLQILKIQKKNYIYINNLPCFILNNITYHRNTIFNIFCDKKLFNIVL